MIRTHTTPNVTPRRHRVQCLVIHATVGSATSALAWLCNPAAKVSADYLIDKTGRTYQLTPDPSKVFTWHAGVSHWRGLEIQNTLNPVSIGIELENRNNGIDPYPPAQLAALTALSQSLIAQYAIPLINVVRHLDVSPGRKTDPAGFPWREWRTTLTDTPGLLPVTSDSTILEEPRADLATIRARFPLTARTNYDAAALSAILTTYDTQCRLFGVDPLIAVAQMAHETGALTSWWSAPPRRNPAGIGVNGQMSLQQPGSGAWAYDGRVWQAGLSFDTWDDAIDAHLGRLLAYALRDDQANEPQRAAITRALALRPLPSNYRGVAPTLAGLNTRWAVGAGYAAGIARWANRLAGA